ARHEIRRSTAPLADSDSGGQHPARATGIRPRAVAAGPAGPRGRMQRPLDGSPDPEYARGAGVYGAWASEDLRRHLRDRVWTREVPARRLSRTFSSRDRGATHHHSRYTRSDWGVYDPDRDALPAASPTGRLAVVRSALGNG